jgi:pyruvate/2-oxoglutarate/acetoin dehydrogenase E1 component
MPQMTMVQAIQDALRIALREDPRVMAACSG